jgi:hypothetical protein
MAELSKTQIAVARVLAGEKAPTVGKELGISATAIYSAIKRRKDKTLCPCCGQVVREGFVLNKKAVAK